MEELFHIGLINDEKVKASFLDRFPLLLGNASDYSVFISEKHGNGAGNYEISDMHIDGSQMHLELKFEKKPTEIGSAVMNRRILIIKTGSQCELLSVATPQAASTLSRK